ncbi:tail protein X [Perlucidibaca piscinae]|uniref:tail protein X n=1 Tax=Perlucidibaca piscinae TaxID=392589 RepID=UPI0003B52CD7|nr:tail protein X [Perlucidibaca piscinae]
MQVRALQGDTVDLIAWRHFGRTAGVVEQILELNRGLAAAGVILPEGHMVTLPDEAPAVDVTSQLVQLWD